MTWDVYESPLGPITLTASPRGLTGLFFDNEAPRLDDGARDPGALAEARRELDEYFAGARRVFELPLDPSGTAFQRRVWDELLRVEYGTTTTYGALARRIGRPSAIRAVGAANGRNPISIVVPCHRVIGASGDLTGYGGGLDRKRALLELERQTRSPST
jgi:methylated-DNA-[protein]-cysteine S-methyltransferase